MNDVLLQEQAIRMEKKLWEAFASGDADSFSELVSTDALMVCGGYKESGSEYAKIVAQIKINDYSLEEFETRVISPNAVLTNYIVRTQCDEAGFSGAFRVSSIWMDNGHKWELVFNQDSMLSS